MKYQFTIPVYKTEKIKASIVFLSLFLSYISAYSNTVFFRKSGFQPVAQQKDTVAPVTREEIKKAMERVYLDKGPKPGSVPKPVMEIIEKVKQPDHERWYIKYLVDKGEYAYAYILLPLNMQKGKKLPLVMCPHPTSDIGKDRVVGIYKEPAKDEKDQIKRENRQYALELVRRGYIAFAPDRAAYGERRRHNGGYKTEMPALQKELSAKYPGWTINGKVIYDLKKALDFLTELDFVDSSNIATIGHSLGAWDSIFLIAFDERVKAAVVNSGGMMNYRPELWKSEKALRAYLQDTTKKKGINNDVNIFFMLAAPRSVLYQYSLFDTGNKGGKQLIEGFRDVTDYYKKVNKSNKADVNYYLHGYGHDFTIESRELAYTWLDRRLKQK